MAYSEINKPSTTGNTPASYPGVVSRISNKALRKNLLSIDVCINDSTNYSPYYFNVIRKPIELKLGGNIFEFAPPRNKFKVNSVIEFEAVDSQNNPLAYEILPQNKNVPTIRLCVFIDNNTVAGNATITLAGEAVVDECGCPLPENCQDRINVRWSSVTPVRLDDVSDIIEYDTAPVIAISETKVPWTYQTYQDVASINPGAPGSPYTVSGTYNPIYNSEQTNSGSNSDNGKFLYTRDIEPDTSSLGQGTIQVYTGNFQFSSSMVGGILYVSGGLDHISSPVPSFNQNLHRAPAFYATISAVKNATTAEVQPAYSIKAINPGGDVQDFSVRTFDSKLGFRLAWTETSASISYTDPEADTTTMTRVEKTVEQHTSFADISITGLKPVCGVATDVEVFVKSNRVDGPITKLTEFPIQPTNTSIDDSRSTDEGNSKEFVDIGKFANQGVIDTYWELGSNVPATTAATVVTYQTHKFMDSAKIGGGTPASIADYSNYITFNTKAAYIKTLDSNTNYFIEFDAYSDIVTNNDPNAKIELYISGSGVDPTNKSNPDETVLGQYIGCIENVGTAPAGETFIGNSFEFKNIVAGKTKPIFVVRSGTWALRDVKVTTSPGVPAVTGITPNSIRALIPMPAITKFNDEYSFELRYKNKNTTANKVSTLSKGVQFEGNDPSAFLAGQPNSYISNPIYHGLTAITSSKNFYVTGSVYVSGDINANAFHTNIISSSILFEEGDTVFGNDLTDIHITSGSVFITSSLIQNITNNYTIKRPEGDKVFTILEGHVTQSGDIRVDQPGTTTPAIIIKSDVAGVATIANGVGDPVILLDDGDRNLYFFDKGGEHIKGDGTDLELTSGGLIKFTPSAGAQISAGKPFNFGDAATRIVQTTDGQLDIDADVELEITSPIVDIDASDGLYLDGADLKTDWLVSTNKRITFRDANQILGSSAAGQLDFNANTEIEITAPTVDIDASFGLTLDGANLASDWTVNGSNQINFRDTDSYILSHGVGYMTIHADKGVLLGDATSAVTASAISASGTITAFKIAAGNDRSGLSFEGNVTASNDISAGGKLTVDGTVGIGASVAGTKLQVNSSTTDLVARFISSDNKAAIEVSDDDTIGYLSAENDAISIGSVLGPHVNNLNIKSTNVGIGTASPGEKLEVVGNMSASGVLFFSASHVVRQADQTHQGVLVYDSGSGQVFMTGSYGGAAGGGGGVSANNATITVTAGDGIRFASGDGAFTTNQSGNETIADIAVDVSDFAGTGLADDGSENLVIDVASDDGAGKHFLTFVDGNSGAQQIKTNDQLSFDPSSQTVVFGPASVYIDGHGSITASKNIWVSHSSADGQNSFISASQGRLTHITASVVTASTIGSATGSFGRVVATTLIGDGKGITGEGASLDRGSDARGDILYRGATEYQRLVAGTAGYALIMGDADPTWALVDTGNIADDAIEEEQIGAGEVKTAALADDAVDADKLAANAVVNASVATGAAIAFTKLENLDSAKMLVGNGSNKATEVAITGDISINNAGVVAIGATKVVNSMIGDGAVNTEELADDAITLAKLADISTGAIIYGAASNTPNRLEIGTSGQVLTAAGDPLLPTWADSAGGAHGSDTFVQFNDGGSALGTDSTFTFNKTSNVLTAGSAVTISNALGKSPMHIANIPPETGNGLVLQRDRITGNIFAGNIQTTYNNVTNTYVTQIIANTENTDPKGDPVSHGQLVADTYVSLNGAGASQIPGPAIVMGSGSISFFTSSFTSSAGQIAGGTGSALMHFFQDRKASDDGMSFVMTGSTSAKVYFSGSGKFGIGTTNPTNDVDIKTDTFKIRSKDGTKEIEFGQEGQLKTRKFSGVGGSGALETTGSEVVMSYSPGTFDTPVRARTGDVMGSIRWEDESFAADIKRKASTPMQIDGIISSATTDGVSGYISFKTSQAEAIDGGPVEQFAIREGSIISSASLSISDGNSLVFGTSKDGVDRSIKFLHTTTPFIMGIDDSQDRFVINQGGAFVSENDVELSSNSLNLGSSIAFNVTHYAAILGGVHVGGTSDPGDDNLVVDGTTTLTGNITATGNVTASNNISASGGIQGGSVRANDLTAGRVAFAGTDGLLVDDSDLTFATATLTATNIAAFNLTGKLTAGSTEIEGSAFDINGGTIDGATIATSDIAIGEGNTLDTRNGTLNLSAAQALTILQGAGANVDIGTFSLTANTLVSDVADGTAPLVVTSTTRVANLQASTVGTIAGLAPNTATTQATQAAITTAANLTTVGALNAGSITSGFTSIDVGSGAISSTTFVGTKHILYNSAFYVNDNPFIQNSLYFGGNLGHQQSNWNDPQAIGGDPMTVSTFNIGDDDQNWGHILPFDVSKIEILCGLRPGGTHTDQFSLVLYTAPRTENATAITLTRVAENGVNFLSGGKYRNNDLTYTADVDAGVMIYVGVGTNTSSPTAKNARGYMSITVTQR